MLENELINEFLKEICRIDQRVKESYIIVFTGEEKTPFNFGFIESSDISQQTKERCYEIFKKYFPSCELINPLI